MYKIPKDNFSIYIAYEKIGFFLTSLDNFFLIILLKFSGWIYFCTYEKITQGTGDVILLGELSLRIKEKRGGYVELLKSKTL